MPVKLIEKRFEFFLLSLILIFATLVRSLFFAGFGLGDDSFYASTSKNFMEHGFKLLNFEFGSNYRIGLWIPISFFFRIFGINSISFVLFPFLTSLGLIVLVYLIGKELANEKVGLIAAFFLSITPFDSVFASTLTIDIPTGFLLALSFLCFIKGSKSSKHSLAYYLTASICLIWAYFIKIPSVFMVFVFPLISLTNFKKVKKHLIFYIILGGLFLESFAIDYALNGDPLHYLHQELKYGPKPDSFQSIGIWYFKWMFTRDMSFNTLLFGYFFYISVLSIAYCMGKKIKRSYTLLMWFFTIFLCLEFFPMDMNPYLVTPRFFRYTYSFFIPAILTSSIALYSVWKFLLARFRSHSALIKIFFSIFLVALAYTSLLEGNKLASLYKDSFSDSDEAAIFLSKLEPKAIYADNAMLDRFNFDTAYERINQTTPSFIINFQKNVIEGNNHSFLRNISDAYVVCGGARAPDLSPDLALNTKNFQVPKNWALMEEIKKETTSYRTENLKVFYTFKTKQ